MSGLNVVCGFFFSFILFMNSCSALNNPEITFGYLMFYSIVSIICILGFLLMTVFHEKRYMHN